VLSRSSTRLHGARTTLIAVGPISLRRDELAPASQYEDADPHSCSSNHGACSERQGGSISLLRVRTHHVVTPVIRLEELLKRHEHRLDVWVCHAAPSPLVALVGLADADALFRVRRAQRQTHVDLRSGERAIMNVSRHDQQRGCMYQERLSGLAGAVHRDRVDSIAFHDIVAHKRHHRASWAKICHR
jgi:hypothetical protein